IYRDRVPLRPPDDMLHLEGLSALLAGGFSGPMRISMGVNDWTRPIAESSTLAQVSIGPSILLRLALAAGPLLLLLLAIGSWWVRRRWRRRRVHWGTGRPPP